ncbi:MAG: alanine racemase [Candidatus Binatia bacterium]|nr:MAG: alanine racemase [Candidatus Binatia bacterium]
MDAQHPRSACAAIDAAALHHNLERLRARLHARTRLLAVVKADGYGHGALLVARELASGGVDAFGVATAGEGAELRAAGLRQPVLVLAGARGPDLRIAAEHDLSVALLDGEHLREIESLRLPRPLRVHVKVDTGMGRLGTDVDALPGLLSEVEQAHNVVVEGVFSHFGNAESVDNEFCREQLRRFRQAVELVKRRWPASTAHLANSVATWSNPETHFDMVRPGLLLYGVRPNSAVEVPEVRPVMSLTAPVLQVRELPEGRAVSYGQTYVTRRRTRLAVLGVGYADGYDRRLSNVGRVVLRGRAAAVVGRICMDVTLVDVTEIPEVSVGDRALLWGAALPVEEVAACAGTISYELLTRLSRRVPRYLHEEQQVESPTQRDTGRSVTVPMRGGRWQRSSER